MLRDSRLLSRLRRPLGCFQTELLRVLRVQPLPAAEHLVLGAHHRPNRLTREEPLKDIEADVRGRGAPRDEAAINLALQRQARGATKGFEFPPNIAATPVVFKHLGASARDTAVSETAAPKVVSFTPVPAVPGSHLRQRAPTRADALGRTFSVE